MMIGKDAQNAGGFYKKVTGVICVFLYAKIRYVGNKGQGRSKKMNGLVNGVGINVEVERNWTWVSGNTYPVKEELKQQGFLWSAKRRAWYNRSIVEVKINGNGHGTVKEAQHTKEDAQEAKKPIEMVKTKAKEKTLEEEVFEYIKTKEAYPLISGEWLSKQEKLGKTFLQLKPRIDDLIEEFLETEKRAKKKRGGE